LATCELTERQGHPAILMPLLLNLSPASVGLFLFQTAPCLCRRCLEHAGAANNRPKAAVAAAAAEAAAEGAVAAEAAAAAVEVVETVEAVEAEAAASRARLFVADSTHLAAPA
jgi:hypothetical protein